MLNQKRRVEKGEITEEEASKEVGKKLYGRWVEPLTRQEEVPKEESYEEYYRRISSKSK
jgi:hypothetical protein